MFIWVGLTCFFLVVEKKAENQGNINQKNDVDNDDDHDDDQLLVLSNKTNKLSLFYSLVLRRFFIFSSFPSLSLALCFALVVCCYWGTN